MSWISNHLSTGNDYLPYRLPFITGIICQTPLKFYYNPGQKVLGTLDKMPSGDACFLKWEVVFNFLGWGGGGEQRCQTFGQDSTMVSSRFGRRSFGQANYQNLYETEFSTDSLLIDAKAVQWFLTHISCMCQSRDCTHSVPCDSEVSVGNCQNYEEEKKQS